MLDTLCALYVPEALIHEMGGVGEVALKADNQKALSIENLGTIIRP